DVLAVVSRAAHLGQSALTVRLGDGRSITASPEHPTVDGRVLAGLRPGDQLDGATVDSVQWLSYHEAATYDILPAGGSGTYWADGVLLKSTLP
ncbi:MAG: hypothetical protein HW397_610, partial [Dehalococcoidia bacterium]|nr:hypothetical protein [Dehalococcoidia bacterium]